MEIENPGAEESKSLAGGSEEMNRRMEDCFPFLHSLALDPPPSCRIAAAAAVVGGGTERTEAKVSAMAYFSLPVTLKCGFQGRRPSPAK